jgi:thiol-disulfide isomerase/thioredoxin
MVEGGSTSQCVESQNETVPQQGWRTPVEIAYGMEDFFHPSYPAIDTDPTGSHNTSGVNQRASLKHLPQLLDKETRHMKSLRSQCLRSLACSSLLTTSLLFTISSQLAHAQSAGSYCEASAAVKADLQKVTQINDEDLPFKLKRERQTALMQKLAKQYPNDFFIQRRYQTDRRSGFGIDQAALLADYRAQWEKQPNDPLATYLYVRLLIGQNTKEAIATLEKLIQRMPDFPWSYLQMAEIYNYPNFRDAAKAKENLKQFIAKCPAALDSVAMVSRGGDKELMAEVAQRLRTRLETATTNDDLGQWDNLWTLEFKLKAVPEHAQLRQQIAEDLKRLRAKNLNSKEWFLALQTGYKQAGDKENQRWAEDEMVRLFPNSETARSTVQRRWYDAHPYPKPDDTDEKKQAYHRAVVQITAEWLKQWPDDERSWFTRFNALNELPDSTNEEVGTAYDKYAQAHAKNEGYSYIIPPVELSIARTYLKRNFRLEQAPGLILKGLTDIERLEGGRTRDDLYPREEGSGGNLRYVRWQAWPLLAEVYARLKQPDKAREVLTQMAEALQKEKPGEKAKESLKLGFANNQATYWQTTAKVAEAEQRKLDALTAYQTALAFRPATFAPKPGKPDELSDNTQRLWKDLGGTEQGWRAYLARNEASKKPSEVATAAAWDAKNTLLPDFELADLQGRKWKLADLKGKTAFINLWATWCGPCLRELPYVQKLSEQMKEHKDVLILTLNIDEELGLVEPFMKENKYNFPVILGQAYAQGTMGVYSIPRNWIVSVDGKLTFEGIGFGNEGEEWIKKAQEMLQKVKGTN